jgi:hypothetical protein
MQAALFLLKNVIIGLDPIILLVRIINNYKI